MIALIYPYIVPKAEAYRPDFKRFIESYAYYDPGEDHRLFLCPCNGSEIAAEDMTIAGGVPWFRGVEYYGEGCDIGCHIHAANWLPDEFDWVVCMSSAVHFHRDGWLAKMVDARSKLGQSLYGGMASKEQLRPHIRTCFYAIEPKLLRGYPETVNSRVKSLQFESQPNNFLGWLQGQGMTGYLVTWDGIYGPDDYRKPDNVFRRGDQSNCLVWDKHTVLYSLAGPAEKETLEKLANGVPPPF